MQEPTPIISKKGKKPKAKITLLNLLANTKTADARRLLKKYGQPDATDYNDLALKLAELYQGSTEKVAIEKEFAEMHPHKELILRNLAPKIAEVKVTENTSPFTPEQVDQLHKQFIGKNDYSNCSGNSTCKCQSNFSNACGCGGSHFDGGPNTPQQQAFGKDVKDWIGPIMLLFVVGTMGYVITSINKANK